MVSEPNFILGIKQKSLASKEDSHVHITVRNHTCLSAGSRLHSISQPPWLTTVSRSSSPSNLCLSLSDLFTSSLYLSKPTPQTCSSASREENLEIRSTESYPRAVVSPEKSTTRRLRFLTSRSSSWYTRRPDGLVVHRSTWLENLVVIQRLTRFHAPPGSLASPSRAGGLSTRLPCAETLLLTSFDDVITPRQQPHKHVHVSPKHVIRHVN